MATTGERARHPRIWHDRCSWMGEEPPMPSTICQYSCVERARNEAAANAQPLIVLTQSGLVRAIFSVDERDSADGAARFWADLYGSAVTRHLVDVHTATPPVAGSAFRADEEGWRPIGRIEARAARPLRRARHGAEVPARNHAQVVS
jgi:hypothetical protein